MRIKDLFATTALLLLLSGTPFAGAETNAPAIEVRAASHPDFDRLVFDWPHTVSYKIHREGDLATIQFEAPAQTHLNAANLPPLTRANNIQASTDAKGQLSISFTLNPKATIKDFTHNKSIVIDIQGEAAPQHSAKAETPPAPQPAPAPSKAEAPPATPTVKTANAPLSLTPPPSPAPVPTPATPPAPIPAKAATAQPPITPPNPTKTSPLSLQEIGDIPILIASLDPHTPIRAAIYQRGGYGYILFDRKLTLDLPALTAGQPPQHATLIPLNLPKVTGFSFPVPPDIDLRATREGTVWQIFLSKQQPEVPVSTSLVAQPDFALGARFLLPLPDAPEPIPFTDPIVGDELILVPLEQTQAFSVARHMAEFNILPAAQGLVLRPLTERIIVRTVSDGIEITAEGGLHLSSSNDTGASQQSSQKARAAAAGKSMFDFATWQGKPSETFTATRQRLQQTIVDVPEPERNRARLELARFYFAHGYGEEASSMLDYLAGQVPDLKAHTDFMALVGASKILAYHAEDGLKDLSAPKLAGQPEIELWQAVALAEMREWAQAEEKFAITENMLDGYPEPFYSRFLVLAIESALAVGKDREASDWLDILETAHHRPEVDVAIQYLHGVLHAKTGRIQTAQDEWKKVASSNDRLYKIRAEMALVDLGVSTHSLTPAQAADRLEAMRFGWRGDDLELDILHRLGQFYVQAHNIKAGLAVLSQAIQLYPNSPMTPAIRTEMASIFHDTFLGDLGKNISALDSLTLYQQYRDLTPTGKDGVAVMHNLAERLVAIDLLDQAAGLLEDLVKNRLTGEEKAHTGVRLAAIRLLDRKPDKALEALDLSNNDTLPTDLQNERQLLRAKALSELHKDTEALALLNKNNSEPAKLLRADITMHAQQWGDAAKALLDLIGPPPKEGGTVTPSQSNWLINCAIALALAGDATGLDKLAIDYGPAMATMPENNTFHMLTEPEKTTQLHDIGAAQARISDADMFQGFLNTYRTAPEPEKKKTP